MEEQVINFKTAKLAKEKGFSSFSKEALAEFECVVDECYINKRLLFNQDGFDVKHELVIEAPTQSLLQKWLRDKYKILVTVHSHFGRDIEYSFTIEDICIIGDGKPTFYSKTYFKSYEFCLEKGLFKALTRIKLK